MNYRQIDHLLLNVNKGPGATGPNGSAKSGAPRPGDSVMVSVGERTLLNILIHRTTDGNRTLMGETIGAVWDSDGREIIGEAFPVSFSYQKIAGVHRR